MNLKPEINTKLYGYSDFFSSLNSIYEKKTLPNKIIFSGNKGIGKSTFAYHFINFILVKRYNIFFRDFTLV